MKQQNIPPLFQQIIDHDDRTQQIVSQPVVNFDEYKKHYNKGWRQKLTWHAEQFIAAFKKPTNGV